MNSLSRVGENVALRFVTTLMPGPLITPPMAGTDVDSPVPGEYGYDCCHESWTKRKLARNLELMLSSSLNNSSCQVRGCGLVTKSLWSRFGSGMLATSGSEFAWSITLDRLLLGKPSKPLGSLGST